ncbi:MAG: hypothetical protein AAGA90_19450 [Actinomycetota bacterium]
MVDRQGLPGLDDVVRAAVDDPVAAPPGLADVVARTARRRRRKAGTLALVLAVVAGGLTLAAIGDEPTSTVASPPDDAESTITEPAVDGDADSPTGLRLEEIAAVGDDRGTMRVDLVIDGTPPSTDVVAVATLDQAPLDQIAVYLATEDDVLWMCDSWHSWGGAEAAVGLTIPAAWFDPSTLQTESPIVDATSPDGEPALVAKIITCELASGLWQMTIHGPRGGADAQVSVSVTDAAISVLIEEPPAEPAPEPEPEEPLVASDLWLRREAGVILNGTLIVPGQARFDPTRVRLVAVDLVTGDERIIETPDGLLLGDQSPEWAEPRPVLTIWNDRVVVCCSGFGGGSIATYDPSADVWATLPEIPGGFTESYSQVVTVTNRGLVALGRGGAVVLATPDGEWEVVAGPLPDDPSSRRSLVAAAIGDDVLLWPVVFSRSTELGYLLDLATGEWQMVPAPADDTVVPAAPSLVVAGQQFVLVGGLPAAFGGLSEALVVLPLEPQSLTWGEPQFPLPEPDPFEGNIGSQRLLPSESGRLVFDAGALGGGVSLVEIDANTGAASMFDLLDPPDILALRSDGTVLRRSGD